MVTQRKDLNILLLGQTGSGKSTFINAFYNYAAHENIEQILENHSVRYCIPTKFEWYDGEECYSCPIIVGQGEDLDERQEIGKSATQIVKSHLFEFEYIGIRIIDTPGFGDTEGLEKDEKICENLLNFLTTRNEVADLHAIIFLFKPNDNRMTTFFTYCMKQIFSKLHKNSCNNIVFLFTHTRGTNFKPGPTLSLLREVISEIPDVEIPCGKQNIFCLENDCIRYLFALHHNDMNLRFSEDDKEDAATAWDRSSKECIRLIKYIQTLKPHSVDDTIAINTARNYCVKLNCQLPKITKKIEEKINICKAYDKEIREAGTDVDKLTKILYTSTTTKREGKYHVVCRHHKCELKEKHGRNKKSCCSNCKAVSMGFCQKFFPFRSSCKVCGCNILEHVFENMKDYVEVQETKNEDIEINIKDRQALINSTTLSAFEQRINVKKYRVEAEYINSQIAKFKNYLDETAIMCDQKKPESMDSLSDEQDMSPQEISQVLKDLSSLEMTGDDIKHVFEVEDMPFIPDIVHYIQKMPNNWKDVLECAV